MKSNSKFYLVFLLAAGFALVSSACVIDELSEETDDLAYHDEDLLNEDSLTDSVAIAETQQEIGGGSSCPHSGADSDRDCRTTNDLPGRGAPGPNRENHCPGKRWDYCVCRLDYVTNCSGSSCNTQLGQCYADADREWHGCPERFYGSAPSNQAECL